MTPQGDPEVHYAVQAVDPRHPDAPGFVVVRIERAVISDAPMPYDTACAEATRRNKALEQGS